MKPLYVPKGKAKEYGDYAVNIYTGCPHRCYYCFAPNVLHRDREEFHTHVEPRPGIVDALKKQLELESITGQVLPCFFNVSSNVDAKPKLPYITYSAVTGDFDNNVQISGSLWYSGYSWADADRKAAEINTALAHGGKLIPYTGGALWIRRGTPFAQHMADDDDTIRRIYLNLTAEFLSAE